MSHLKAFIAHYIGAAFGLVLLFSKIDWSPLGPVGNKLAAGLGTAIVIGHALGVQPSKIVAKASAWAVLLLAPALFLLGGCATTASQVAATITSPAAQPFLQAGADVAVATAEQKGVSPSQIYSVTTAVLAADQGTATTLAALSSVANAQLARLNLPAADVAAFTILEDAFNVYVQTQVGNNATVAQLQAAVADFLKAILAAPGVTPATSSSSSSSAAPTAQTTPPPAKAGGLAAVESPTVVGAAMSALVVAGLQAFFHITTSAPVAAAGVVTWTMIAAYLGL